MKIQITLLSVILSFGVQASEEICKKAVENAIKVQKNWKDNPFPQALDNPGYKTSGIKRCKAEVKTSKGLAECKCAMKAKNIKDLHKCG